MRLIDADPLWEKACDLEQEALDAFNKAPKENKTELQVWSAILADRTAFKFDIFDAPTIAEPEYRLGYRECADAMLLMWMNKILTDSEYNKIMDKLNAKFIGENKNDRNE